jgi:hypothetical protein
MGLKWQKRKKAREKIENILLPNYRRLKKREVVQVAQYVSESHWVTCTI